MVGAAQVDSDGWDMLTPAELEALQADEQVTDNSGGGSCQPWVPAASIGAAVRALRKQERQCTANYLLSISEDAEFVRAVREQFFPSAAVFANLRAGAWYVPPSEQTGTCYFKSTDGHFGHWDFSLHRLNLHVARLAAQHGSAVVVDSTRRGKRFPDALSKTVPIWCAVLTTALAVVAQQLSASEDATAADLQFGQAACHMHLPRWISSSERDQIEKRLLSWVERFVAALGKRDLLDLAADIGAAVGPAARSVPHFRPVWLCPGDNVAAVSAEAKAWQEAGHIPIISISASHELNSEACREQHSWTYIQGAGDDDENWASRVQLTPTKFWQQAPALITAARESAASLEELLERPFGLSPVSLVEQQDSFTAAATLSSRQAFSRLGDSGLAIGNFSVGAPPAVWDYFDAVLNCGSGEEHKGMRGDPNYLALAVADGKKADPSKDWWQVRVLPAVLRFAYKHRGKRLLIHCTSGDTRSPALVASILAAFYDVETMRFSEERAHARPVLSKEELRRSLVLVQRYHPYCNVPRRNMQQLNLFFVTTGGGWSRWEPEGGGDDDSAVASPPGDSTTFAKPVCETMDSLPADPGFSPDEILPSLLLGTARYAGSLPLLRERGVTHVVNVTCSQNPFPDALQYHQVPIEDHKQSDLRKYLDGALSFMRAALLPESGPTVVLVHCQEGVSRSVAVIAAYLVRYERIPLEDALSYIRNRRPPGCKSCPNCGFMKQLLDFQAAEGLSRT